MKVRDLIEALRCVDPDARVNATATPTIGEPIDYNVTGFIGDGDVVDLFLDPA